MKIPIFIACSSFIVFYNFLSLSPKIIQTPEEGIEWLYDIKEARQIASQKEKPILISFAGSDWCKPCIKLTREVFNNPQFEKYAKESFVLVLADFPRHKKNRLTKEQLIHNESLAKKYNKEGRFPLVVVIGIDGEIASKIGYVEGGASAYIAHLEAAITKNN